MNKTKITLSDAFMPVDQCKVQISGLTWVCLLVACVFWGLRAFRALLHLGQFWEIKHFFNAALKITDVILNTVLNFYYDSKLISFIWNK